MNLTERDSGLIVPEQPVEPPARPQRVYGPLEIQDAEKRRVAHTALVFLWEAMELEKGDHLGGSRARYAAHLQTWKYMGEMLLGEDCPDCLVLT